MTRKAKIAITTNKMPESVYRHLRSKSESGELSKYLIRLVEKDLDGIVMEEHISSMKEEMNELHSLIREMKKTCVVEPVVRKPMDTLVHVEIVPDEEINPDGIRESTKLDF